MIFDVLKRSHGANKFTDNKFINGTHSTPVLTEYPTLRTWVTCVKINRSEVHPILTVVVKFKLYPTSVAQVHPTPGGDTICSALSNRRKFAKRCCVDVGMGLVGPAPHPLHHLYLDQSEAHIGPRKIETGPPYYLGVWMNEAPTNLFIIIRHLN